MSAESDDPSRRDTATPKDRDGSRADSSALSAGRVGRAHGLDGSFYVTAPKPRLLALGVTVKLDGRVAEIVRRAGTDEHPLIRLRGVEDRGAAEALRGLELIVDFAEAPELEEGEWWAGELEGCEVFDGQRRIGTVHRLVELPSCEALEVRLDISSHSGGVSELLVPMVRDAVRGVDPAMRRIDVDMGFLEELL
ncbi:MAG: ribosome maturation factor RimM [Solirubrobacteraceae bacterium]